MTSDVFRFRVGNLSCVALSDGRSTVTEEDISRLFPKDAERMLSAFRALSAPLAFGVNILLVETAGRRVLIDTGSGQANPADPGRLHDNLRAESIAPESINTVIITHYHLDHLDGLLDGGGNPFFSGARLVVPKQEHEHWMSEESLAAMDPERARRLRHALAVYEPRLSLWDSEAEIEPGIRYVPVPGHTPGHRAVSIDSQGARLLHLADMMHVPMQVSAVDAVPKYDSQPELAITTRRAVVEQAEAEQLLVMLYHFPFPGLGHIQRTGNRLAWAPYLAGSADTQR